MFNILGRDFHLDKASDSQTKSTGASSQTSSSKTSEEPSSPTFLQQLTKGALMLGGLWGLGAALDLLSCFTKNQGSNELPTSQLSDDVLSSSQQAIVISDSIGSTQNSLSFGVDFSGAVIEETNRRGSGKPWEQAVLMERTVSVNPLIENTIFPFMPSYVVGALAISSGFPVLQFAGIGLLFNSLKLTGVAAEQMNATFLTTIGGPGNDVGSSVQLTQDDGLVIAGYTNSYGAGGVDISLTKLLPNATVAWSITVGSSNSDYGNYVQATQDGGYIVAAHTNSFGAGFYDLALIKFTQNGIVSWAKTVGGGGDDFGFSVTQTQDGGYVVTGYTTSFGAGSYDVWLTKFTSSGTLSWIKTYGGNNIEIGLDLRENQDGDLLLTGYTQSYGAGNYDLILIKVTSAGAFSWGKTLGGAGSDVGRSMQITSDGGTIVVGETASFGAGNIDFILAKFTSTGVLSWAKTLGGVANDYARSVQLTSDGGYIVLGVSESFSASGNTVLAKFNSSGDLLWARLLGDGVSGADLQKTPDGRFIVSGTLNSNVYLAALDSNGRILNCNATKVINPTVMDITGFVTVTSPSFTVTTPSPTINTWAVSAVAQNIPQNMTCMGPTRTRSMSLPIPKTPTFLTTIGGSGNDVVLGVQQSDDDGFVASGSTDSFGAGNTDMLLTKFSPNGTLSWVRTVGGASSEAIHSMQKTQDGGYILSGFTNSFGAGGEDFCLLKLTPSGDLSWAKTLGGAFTDSAYLAHQTQDGGYIMVGYTHSYGAGGADVLLIKVTSAGVLSWAKTLGSVNSDYGIDVIQTQDGGFVFTGSTTGFGAGGTDLLLAKFTSVGGLSWTKTLGGTGNEGGYKVQETLGGDYIITGYTDSFGSGNNDVLLALVTSTGTLSWAKAVGGLSSDIGKSILVTEDAGFILVGNTNSFGVGISIIKFNSTGSVSWAKVLRGAESVASIQKTRDGEFIIAANSGSNIFLAKLDPNGNIANCNATQTINPTVTDITGLITVTSPSPTVSTPSPTVNNWVVTAVPQNMLQNMTCMELTKTTSLGKSASVSRTQSQSLNRTHSNSHIDSLSKSKSILDSASHTAPKSRSQTHSPSYAASSSLSLGVSQTHSQAISHSNSLLEGHTPTMLPTRTRAVRRSTSVLIQEFNLPMTGIVKTKLSPSGSLALTETNTGFKFVKINGDSSITEAGQFAILGVVRATVFSEDEKYLFVANDQGTIQIVDLHDLNNPVSVGFVPTNSSIGSLAMSGDGGYLMVGSDKGVMVLSARTPANPQTLSFVTSYPTTESVNAIQTNPNTDVVSIGLGSQVTLLEYKNEKLTLLNQTVLAGPVETIFPADQTNPGQITIKLNNGNTVFVNITNPMAPVITSTLSGVSSELRAVSGTTLLVAGAKPGIQIFENTQKDWNTAHEAGYSPITGAVTSLSFSSDGKFGVYSDSQGFKLIKIIKDPGRLDVPLPRLLNVVKLGYSIRDVLINDANNWIALGGGQLTFIAKENLQKPNVLGVLNTTGNVQQMVFFPDKTKLLLVDQGGVAFVDCFNPEAPRLLGRWNTPQLISGLTLRGSYAYVCQGESGVAVLDLSNPLSIVKKTTLLTLGSAQSIEFNHAHSLAYVADGSGIDIWSMQGPLSYQKISRFNSTGFISKIALSPDEKTVYFASEHMLGQVNVTDVSRPVLSSRLDTTRPIKDILLNNQGTVAYLAAEIDGTLIVDTLKMQVKAKLTGTFSNAVAISDLEDQLFVADMEGGLEVAELLSELSIIPLTATTMFPVGIRVEETLLFFNRKLEPISIDRINSIQIVDNGQKRDLPLWISADLIQRKLFITAPKELTDSVIQLAISVDVDGVRQETLYQTQVTTSLQINADKGSVSMATPSPTVAVKINLSKGSFISQPSGALSVSMMDNTLQAFGAVADINHYLQTVRVNPKPVTLRPSDVALSSVEVSASDLVNLFPSIANTKLRNFRFNQAPAVSNPMNQSNMKALDSFEVSVPSYTFSDPDDSSLSLSAQLVNGTELPSWLTFDQSRMQFRGYAPASMLGQTLNIKLTASDGYLSVNTTWALHIDMNNGPYVAYPLSSLTRASGSEFSYDLPSDLFRDTDNNTLTISAVQEGYDILPGFLNFDSNKNSFVGRPTVDDVKTYRINVIATDKFGSSAKAQFEIKIQFSNWDLFIYVLERIAIASAVISPFTWAYYNRTLIRNTLLKNQYWRNEIPEYFLKGLAYKPKYHKGGDIEKDDIVQIRVLVIEQRKCGHGFASEAFPLYLYIHYYAMPLLNDEAVPKWIELDPEDKSIRLKPENYPTELNQYVYQTLGKRGYILESFFINPHNLSMYQAPDLSTNNSTIDLGSFLASHDDILKPQEWNDDHELAEILDTRPNNGNVNDTPKSNLMNVKVNDTPKSNSVVRDLSPKEDQLHVTIDIDYDLDDNENVSQPSTDPESSPKHETSDQSMRFFKPPVSEQALDLQKALSTNPHAMSKSSRLVQF